GSRSDREQPLAADAVDAAAELLPILEAVLLDPPVDNHAARGAVAATRHAQLAAPVVLDDVRLLAVIHRTDTVPPSRSRVLDAAAAFGTIAPRGTILQWERRSPSRRVHLGSTGWPSRSAT